MQTSSLNHYSLFLSLIPYIFYSTPPHMSQLLTLPSWPLCDCGSLSCHMLKNPRSLKSRVPPAWRSPLAADASWAVGYPLYCRGSTNTRSPSTAKKPNHTREVDVGVREGAFIPTILSHPPTHPPLDSLTAFSIALPPGLTRAHPSLQSKTSLQLWLECWCHCLSLPRVVSHKLFVNVFTTVTSQSTEDTLKYKLHNAWQSESGLSVKRISEYCAFRVLKLQVLGSKIYELNGENMSIFPLKQTWKLSCT